MARFECSGLDDFALSLQQIESLPEDVENKMLSSGADVAVAELKKSVTMYGLVDTGELRDSIKKFHKISRNQKQYYLVYPYGARKKAKVKKLARVRIYGTGRKKQYAIKKVRMTNNDVGFVHEFGAPHRGIPARPWVSLVAEEYADDITEAEIRVFDDWLKSNNL